MSNLKIWDGVYSSFAEISKEGKGFESDRWVNSIEETFFDQKEKISKGECVVSYNNSLLPIVTSLLYHEKNSISILDFGGGIGLTYEQVLNSDSSLINIDYVVVEGKKICDKGKVIFKNDSRIVFLNALPDYEHEFDIVNISSSLHYVQNWKDVLLSLSRYEPKYFVITDLPAGKIDTFATIQNYYDSKIPCWFFSIDEINNFFYSLGYKLISSSNFLGDRLGLFGVLPMDNFDNSFKIKYSKNLIFMCTKGEFDE